MNAKILFFGCFLLGYDAGAVDLYISSRSSTSIVWTEEDGAGWTFGEGSGSAPSPMVLALAFDGAGNLYAAEQGGIWKYDQNLNETKFATVQSPVPLFGLACDANGNLYAAFAYGNSIIAFDSSGNMTSVASVTRPTGLAFDSHGNLFVAGPYNSQSGEIDEIASDGTKSVFADSSSGLNNPVGLAFDASGNLYVANLGAKNILRFDPEGNESVFATPGGYPTNLAFDEQGNLWVTTRGNYLLELRFQWPGAAISRERSGGFLRNCYFSRS